jgi:hypothetical protein
MTLKNIFLFLLLFIFLSLFQCQNSEIKKYTYFDEYTKIHFSFDIPKSWTIHHDSDFTVFIGTCRPTLIEEVDLYKNCFEGIIFRIQYFSSNLDSTLNYTGLYAKTGDGYTTTDAINDSVKTEKIKGSNWTGLYHNNNCGFKCNDSGFHAVGGDCEYIYFSDKKQTICLSTNGKKLETKILNLIIKSFKFEN